MGKLLKPVKQVLLCAQLLLFAIMGWGGNGKGGLQGVLQALLGKAGGKGKSPLKKAKPEQKVWIGGLTKESSWKELQELFNSVAKTKWVEVWHRMRGLLYSGGGHHRHCHTQWQRAGIHCHPV